jgi:hypothetical protein
MKNKIKVVDIFTISGGKTIFIIEIIEGFYNIGDVFIDDDLKFMVKGIGMESQPNSKTKSLLVEIITENSPIKDFKNKIFDKNE